MIKGSSLVLKEISSGLLRRGSKEFVTGAQRRNSICGPCIGLKSPPSKLVSDEPISSFFENSTNLQDLQSQEFNQHTKSNSYSTSNYLSNGNNNNRGNGGRKNSISSIINSIKNERIKNQANLNNQVDIEFPRRFSIDPLSMKKFKSINLDEKLLELEAESNFSSVWSDLVHKYGLENLEFPKEITFLAGSPGSGKGTNTECLKQVLGVQEDPIVMSSLLSSPECVAIKKAGGLVNDKVVLELLLNKLAKPDFLCENQGLKQGVIIDGFPRSAKQVKFVELLYDKLCQIRRSINPNATLPHFRICILHVSEEESVKRQLARGDYANKENIIRKEKNLPLLEIRDTDVDPIASKKRYSLYQDQFNHLKSLENKFDFDMIDANGSKQQVKNIIQSIYQ